VKQSPKLPAEKRQAQLIRAAGKVFMKKGYSAATTEAIAREAGLTKGALYFHFKCKEDIFFAVVRDISDSYQNNVLSILAGETNAEKTILKMIKAAFNLIRKQKYLTLSRRILI
jgi:AcrR family transcriptional regulator